MYFQGGRTIQGLLIKSKDVDTIWQKSGVIYGYTGAKWTVRINILGSQAEHLQKDIKSTQKPIILL